MKLTKTNKSSPFWFRFDNDSAHTTRTMMLGDIQHLLPCVSNPDCSENYYYPGLTGKWATQEAKEKNHA